MKSDSRHIKQIKVVSNTHWDREFRLSFEKTRRRLLDMLDITLDILENDPKYHSYTMDGHTIMIDDYLEMRPERREQVEKFVKQGRLIIGPWYTLSEDFNISHEALVRNLLWGRKGIEKYGGKCGTVAYKPSSWGQTGQMPQILSEFGLNKTMFYRGISHHESDAEWVWQSPDGTKVLASRFAIYSRYNWYYLVHRAVTAGRVFEKDYVWGNRDEVPFRFADSLGGEDFSFDLKSPSATYDKSKLKEAIEKMIEIEGPHFTTEVFLAMHGHDISAAHPLESKIIEDAIELLGDKYRIEHTDLEHYWAEVEKHLDMETLAVLKGERRSYLKEGKWTYLFPASISARTYLKQQDFGAYTDLVYYAEPLASLAKAYGHKYPVRYLERGWQYLMSNHTHDANGGCGLDVICEDMQYRMRKTADIADIVIEDAMTHIARKLSPNDLPTDVMQLIVYNPLPIERNAIVALDLEIPQKFEAKSVTLESKNDPCVQRQNICVEESGVFVDSVWDVPTIIESDHMKLYAQFNCLPGLGYRAYIIKPQDQELDISETMITGPGAMENEQFTVKVNANGSVNILCKKTGKGYENLNYLSDEGECGNAWQHKAPSCDRKYNTLDVTADITTSVSGPLVSCIVAEYNFSVPVDSDDTCRSEQMVDLPVKVEYRLEKGSEELKVKLTLDNRARNHWLRANFPTNTETDVTWADSHFDVVSRLIAIPESTGWVEPACGTHPLRTFVDMNDGETGLAVLSKGLYEYEAFEDKEHTLALSLLRACQIKLMVSEEKKSELSDTGIQCPGKQRFEYAICFHAGGWNDARLLKKAADYYTPVRAAMTGRGKGELPMQGNLFTVDNTSIHITCVKQAEDGSGLIIRLFNPLDSKQTVSFSFSRNILQAKLCRMDESEIEVVEANGNTLVYESAAKKIVTLKLVMEQDM